MNSFTLVLITVFLTLAFEFSNGWHDAANSIATVVSTRVLTPFRAVAWAAFWNFVAAFGFGTAVANTIGKGMVHIEMVDSRVLLAGLLGAITPYSWPPNQFFPLFTTARFGIPVSTTHTITGAIVGVGASRRLTAVRWGVTQNILWAWILTIPGAALLGAGIFRLLAPLMR